jgi:hypothetical protein
MYDFYLCKLEKYPTEWRCRGYDTLHEVPDADVDTRLVPNIFRKAIIDRELIIDSSIIHKNTILLGVANAQQ